MAHIILKPSDTEDERLYVVNESQIETIPLNQERDHYGQAAGADNAGDYLLLKTDHAVRVANADLSGWEGSNLEEFEAETIIRHKFKINDVVNAHENYTTFCAVQEHCAETDYDLFEETFTGIEYWDGHNFRTISVEHPYAQTEYEIVNDPDLCSEIETAIENAEWEDERFGCQVGTFGKYKITESRFADAWEKYCIEIE